MGNMNRNEFQEKYVKPFNDLSYIYDERGWIVWRTGTGENVELLHIRVHEKRKGHGKGLVQEMLKKLEGNPPYYSVFGFTRVSNEEAQSFYRALGFDLSEIPGIYKDGRAILFSQEYEKLISQTNEKHE